MGESEDRRKSGREVDIIGTSSKNNNSNISGNLQLKDYQLNVKANIPDFSYDGKVFNNIRLESKGGSDSLSTKIAVDDVAGK